jgi:hypothetical protein
LTGLPEEYQETTGEKRKKVDTGSINVHMDMQRAFLITINNARRGNRFCDSRRIWSRVNAGGWDGTCLGDAPALADAGGAYGERVTGARYGAPLARRSSPSQHSQTAHLQACSEVKCTDSLLPTCCVCHGTQSLASLGGVPSSGQSYLYILVLSRPGATSGCHISLLICLSGRWLAGNKQGLAACAGPRPWSPQFQQSRLRAWERRYWQGREAGEAGSRGARPTNASVSSRPAPPTLLR